MDEPARFARVLLQFLDTTEPIPIDRALLRNRMANRNRVIREQAPPPELEPDRKPPPPDHPAGGLVG